MACLIIYRYGMSVQLGVNVQFCGLGYLNCVSLEWVDTKNKIGTLVACCPDLNNGLFKEKERVTVVTPSAYNLWPVHLHLFPYIRMEGRVRSVS